jgi:hypothetical protein
VAGVSKVAKTISAVAGVIATIAEIAFLVTGNPIFGTIAAIASTVAAVGGAIAVATQKPPDMKGSVNQILIGANMPVPYAMGRTYVPACRSTTTATAQTTPTGRRCSSAPRPGRSTASRRSGAISRRSLSR